MGNLRYRLIPAEAVFFFGFGDFFAEEIDLAADEVAIFNGGGGEFDFEALDARFVS